MLILHPTRIIARIFDKKLRGITAELLLFESDRIFSNVFDGFTVDL